MAKGHACCVVQQVMEGMHNPTRAAMCEGAFIYLWWQQSGFGAVILQLGRMQFIEVGVGTSFETLVLVLLPALGYTTSRW